MKKKYTLQIALCLFLLPLLFLCGCGGSGPGSPGSQGTESTGLIVDVAVTPTYNNKNTSNVDVYQTPDCDTTTTKLDPEYFTDHSGTLTLTARWLNPNAKTTPGTLYIEKYTVEYRRAEDSIGAPPIQQDVRYKTITITPPASTGTTTVTDIVTVLDLTRKNKYYTDVAGGQYSSHPAYINNYTATYVFEGKNQYGTTFSLTTQIPIAVGNYDNCK